MLLLMAIKSSKQKASTQSYASLGYLSMKLGRLSIRSSIKYLASDARDVSSHPRGP